MSDEDLKTILTILYKNNIVPYYLENTWILVNYKKLRKEQLVEKLVRLLNLDEFNTAHEYSMYVKAKLDEMGMNII